MGPVNRAFPAVGAPWLSSSNTLFAGGTELAGAFVHNRPIIPNMIQAHYIWDLTSLDRGIALHLRSNVVARMAPLGALVLVVYAAFEFTTSKLPLVDGLPPLTVGMLLLAGIRPMMRWQFRRAIRRAPTYGCEMNWEFSPERAMISGADSEASFPWKMLHSAVVSADGMLLYPQKNLFHWIPASAFASPEEYAEACAIVEAAGVKVRKA